MRIAFVVTGGLDPSGRERVIPALLSFVERTARVHEVVVYVLRYFSEPRSYSLLGATVHDLGRPEGLLRQYASLLRAVRRDGPFDIMHAYWALPAGFVSTLVARRLGLPSIATLDSGEFAAIPDIGYGLQQHWPQRLAVAATCRLASRLTVCSSYQQRLARAAGLQPDVIPLGVNAAIFQPAPRTEGPPWRLIHVASINPVKNQPLLLRAMRALVDRGVPAHLDIVGEDTLHGAVQALAHDEALDSHVTFHGFQPTDRLVPLYQQAHLALLTSRHEAAGVATLEAAACGVPTLGTPVGFVADWAPEMAIAIDSTQPSDFADAIARALDDCVSRRRMGEAALQWARAHDADWTAAEFDRLYRTTLHGCQRPSLHSSAS